jgi:hypothetical protein
MRDKEEILTNEQGGVTPDEGDARTGIQSKRLLQQP